MSKVQLFPLSYRMCLLPYSFLYFLRVESIPTYYSLARPFMGIFQYEEVFTTRKPPDPVPTPVF